jgi:hypothetical protein
MTTSGISDGRPKEPRRLRELAAWYRRFAEEAGNPVIWEARLRSPAELEREADPLEEASERPREAGSNSRERVGIELWLSPGTVESDICLQISLV